MAATAPKEMAAKTASFGFFLYCSRYNQRSVSHKNRTLVFLTAAFPMK
jgi:hypothetical protein